MSENKSIFSINIYHLPLFSNKIFLFKTLTQNSAHAQLATCPKWFLFYDEKHWADEAHTGIKIARRNINNLRYADDTTLMAESKEELKSLLIKVKEDSEKSWLKAQHSEN